MLCAGVVLARPINPGQTMPVLVSGHGFSLDGVTWHFNIAEQPYNPWVTFANGTRQNYSTFERWANRFC